MTINGIIMKLQMEGKEITFENALELAKEFPDSIIPERKAAMVMSYWNDYNERWKIKEKVGAKIALVAGVVI